MEIETFPELPKSKIDLFENKPVPKAVFTLAFPTIISQIIVVLYNLADTWFISQTDDKLQVAAVTIAFPLFLMLTAISNLFGIGGSGFISRALGQKEFYKAKQGSAFVFWGTIITGLMFSILVFIFRNPLLRVLGADDQTYAYTYKYVFYAIIIGTVPTVLNPVLAHLIRSQGFSMQASIGMSLGGILNIVLDPFFIFPWGLGMNVGGAALATALSNLAATLYFLCYLYLKKNKLTLSLHPKYLKKLKPVARSIINIGFPSSVQLLMSVLSNTVLNKLMSAYSPAALSAVGIVKKVDSLPTAITQGISTGILPLIGYTHAAGQKKRMKKTFHFSAVCAISFSVIFFLLINSFSASVIRWFMDDPQVVSYGSVFLRLHAFSTPFMAIGFMVIALYQGAGNGRPALLLSLFRKGLLDIPFMIILNRYYPMYGLMAVQPIMDVFNAIFAIFLYFVFWKKETNSQSHFSV